MKYEGIFGCLIIILAFAFIAGVSILLGVWTDHNLDYWFSQYRGHPVHVPLWLAWLIACLLNGVAIIANVIAEIAKYL